MSAGAKRAVIVRSGDAGGAAAGAAGAGDSFTGVSPVQAVTTAETRIMTTKRSGVLYDMWVAIKWCGMRLMRTVACSAEAGRYDTFSVVSGFSEPTTSMLKTQM